MKQKTQISYDEYNPVVANSDDKYYPYECAFDFEAMLKKIETKDNEKKLQIVSDHVPVSVSIFSKVPENDKKPIFTITGMNDNTVIVDSNLFEDVRFLQTGLSSLSDLMLLRVYPINMQM